MSTTASFPTTCPVSSGQGGGEELDLAPELRGTTAAALGPATSGTSTLDEGITAADGRHSPLCINRAESPVAGGGDAYRLGVGLEPAAPSAACGGSSTPAAGPKVAQASAATSGDKGACPAPKVFGAELAEEYKSGHVFAVLEDPEADVTWSAITEELKGHFGSTGYELNRNNNRRLEKKKGDTSPGLLRWRVVRFECENSGTPRVTNKTPDAQSRRQCSSKKIGCPFHVTVNWNRNDPPTIGEASVMTHSHEPSPEARQNEMTYDEVKAQETRIRELAESRLAVADINSLFEHDGWLLGRRGKQQVTNMVALARGKRKRDGVHDTQGFIGAIQKEEGSYLKFDLDSEGKLERVFWAFQDQQENAVAFGSVVILDTTFNTNDLGFSLALMVTVDSENKTRIVGQALLRNERTDSFEFVLKHYQGLRHGIPPECLTGTARGAPK